MSKIWDVNMNSKQPLHLAVLGHSFLADHQHLKAPTEAFLDQHPDVHSYYVKGISGLRYEGTGLLLDAMRQADYRPTSILLMLGDNDLTTRDGAPRPNMNVDAFPSAFHASRENAVALCETVAGLGRVCSTVPFPRFNTKGGQLEFDAHTPYNRMAGYYLKQLRIFRPKNRLLFVRQFHMVPYWRGRSLYPRKPDPRLYEPRDGIHPAAGSFHKLFKPVLQEWISRC